MKWGSMIDKEGLGKKGRRGERQRTERKGVGKRKEKTWERVNEKEKNLPHQLLFFPRRESPLLVSTSLEISPSNPDSSNDCNLRM